jgi:hypothetical protein
MGKKGRKQDVNSATCWVLGILRNINWRIKSEAAEAVWERVTNDKFECRECMPKIKEKEEALVNHINEFLQFTNRKAIDQFIFTKDYN